jgi:hypothetical protein
MNVNSLWWTFFGKFRSPFADNLISIPVSGNVLFDIDQFLSISFNQCRLNDRAIRRWCHIPSIQSWIRWLLWMCANLSLNWRYRVFQFCWRWNDHSNGFRAFSDRNSNVFKDSAPGKCDFSHVITFRQFSFEIESSDSIPLWFIQQKLSHQYRIYGLVRSNLKLQWWNDAKYSLTIRHDNISWRQRRLVWRFRDIFIMSDQFKWTRQACEKRIARRREK